MTFFNEKVDLKRNIMEISTDITIFPCIFFFMQILLSLCNTLKTLFVL